MRRRQMIGLLCALTVFIAGIRLLLGHLGIASFDLKLPLWTGLGIAALLLVSMIMPLLRLTGNSSLRQVQWHTLIGPISPLLLAAHTVSYGYGYTYLLCGLFLSCSAIAAWMMIRPAKTAKRRRRVQSGHTFLAITLIPIVLIHIWNVAYYE